MADTAAYPKGVFCSLLVFRVKCEYEYDLLLGEKSDAMLPERDKPELLAEIIRRIRETTTPERVILFGSYARGANTSDSDLDLLVIVRGVTRPRAESTRIRRALRGLLVPIDVIVATPEQIERYRDSPSMVYASALREGQVLYERAPAA